MFRRLVGDSIPKENFELFKVKNSGWKSSIQSEHNVIIAYQTEFRVHFILTIYITEVIILNVYNTIRYTYKSQSFGL